VAVIATFGPVKSHRQNQEQSVMYLRKQVKWYTRASPRTYVFESQSKRAPKCPIRAVIINLSTRWLTAVRHRKRVASTRLARSSKRNRVSISVPVVVVVQPRVVLDGVSEVDGDEFAIRSSIRLFSTMGRNEDPW
jgi:hypothetical protein